MTAYLEGLMALPLLAITTALFLHEREDRVLRGQPFGETVERTNR